MWAILPLKDLVQAKSRLAGLLSPSERRALAQAMVEDVLRALTSAPSVDGVVLVSDDPAAQLLAHRYRLHWLEERQLPGRGLNAAINGALAVLEGRGVSDAMIVHGDLPLVTAADFETLIAHYRRIPRSLVIAPDRHHLGTNIMLLPVGLQVTLAYGQRSCSQHSASAAELGYQVELVQRPGSCMDVDEPRDLIEVWQALDQNRVTGKTATLVTRSDIGRRLALMESADDDDAAAVADMIRSQHDSL